MNVCTFCDKTKDAHELIEGMNGYLCTSCLTIMQGIDNSKDVNNKTRNLKNNNKNNNKNISNIKKEVDEVVFGQENAKKQLIMELYKHKSNQGQTTNNIFLVGDSGVGKTHLIRTLTNIMDVPYIEVDATTFTETGYKGDDITDILDRLILKESGDIERVEKSVIFIDEIDKTTTTMNESASSSKVQEALLKMIEGVEYNYNLNTNEGKIQGVIDTSNIMFIVAGACVGLKEIRDNRMNPNKNNIGFNVGTNTISEDESAYLGEDLINFGFIPEFIGRYSLIIELEPLTKENIYSILLDSPNSILKKNQDIFKSKNIELLVDDTDIDYLVDKVYDNPLGVRGISQFLTKHINDLLYDSLLNNKRMVELSLNKTNANEIKEYNIG